MSFFEPSNGYSSNGGGASSSTSTAFDVGATLSWAAPPSRGTASAQSEALSFFTSNNSLAHGAGDEQQQQRHDYDHSTSQSGGAQYSALPVFDEGDGAGSEAGSNYSGRGRNRKRSQAASESVCGGWEGETSGDEGGSTKSGKKGKGAAGAKAKGKGKRRLEDEEEGQSEVDGVKKPKAKPKRPPGDKKKKAGRACAACQKAHLTCDDARPCARCVKKGCPESCHDGTRKKAKYLMEIPDELLERGRHPPPQPSVEYQPPQVEAAPLEGTPGAASGGSPADALQPEQAAPFSFDTPLYFDSTFGTNEFGSEAANLEYAILSSMLNGNGFAIDNYGSNQSGDPRLNGAGNGNTMLINSPLGNTLSLSGSMSGPSPMNGNTSYLNNFRPTTSTSTSPANNFVMSPRLDTTQNLFPQDGGKADDASPAFGGGGQGSSADMYGASSGDQYASTSTAAAAPAAPQPVPSKGGVLTAEEAYRSTTKPYPYAQSYHYLVKHLKERFEKNDILRIIRALATYRPSLIALQMPLTEEDEIFVERTIQRTLVELNKLISFSGTPTVVWRRTGEICLVGTEFCLLTGWSRDELLGKKYIFELLDTVSVVDLYESFAKHAFESTSSSVTMQAVVLGPTGRPVPCAFCFSIRRDLFSCPSLVVGSFLPILT